MLFKKSYYVLSRHEGGNVVLGLKNARAMARLGGLKPRWALNRRNEGKVAPAWALTHKEFVRDRWDDIPF